MSVAFVRPTHHHCPKCELYFREWIETTFSNGQLAAQCPGCLYKMGVLVTLDN